MRVGCAPLGRVDASDVAAWIAGISFDEWPQQHKVDEQLRPAMVTDLAWHGFGKITDRVVGYLMAEHFPGLRSHQRMLSVVMPGHCIPAHCDGQAPTWICRVHVPLMSNERSAFVVEGVPHMLEPGLAYRIDTTVEHGVTNEGDSPRIHFMFDVGKS